MKEIVKIKSIGKVTHDVLKITLEKPEGFSYEPGQATEISLNRDGWKEEKRPFTPTSLPSEENLEYTIKTYPSHKGVTEQLLHLKEGDEFIIHDVFGTITYRGEGIFIAGGAGVTPFIAIFRGLEKSGRIGNNKLIFANKTRADIILKDYFSELLGENFINILSEESTEEYAEGLVTKDFLQKHIDSKDNIFYICGPDPLIEMLEGEIHSLGFGDDAIVKEVW